MPDIINAHFSRQ